MPSARIGEPVVAGFPPVAVVTDSTAALTAEEAAAAGVTVVPLHVLIDNEEFTEGVDVVGNCDAALAGGDQRAVDGFRQSLLRALLRDGDGLEPLFTGHVYTGLSLQNFLGGSFRSLRAVLLASTMRPV